MPMNYSLVVEPFDVWGFDYMGSFSSSNRYTHILVVADYANYIVAKFIPPSFTYQQKKKFFYDLRHYFWDDPHLYKKE